MQVGAAIVLAITTAIIATDADVTASPQAALESYRPGLIFAAAVSIVGAFVAALALLPRREELPADAALDPVPQPEPEYVVGG
jgi:hypothetical protein